jgi:hypothetical protein
LNTKEKNEFSELLEPYLREYTYQQYGMSIKMSRELYKDTEDKMATAYTSGDRMAMQQQAANISPQHQHSLGGLGGLAGAVFPATGWSTSTSTTSLPDSMWEDRMKEPEPAGKWSNRWFRVNEDMSPGNFGLRSYNPEPLDELRMEIGDWLYNEN